MKTFEQFILALAIVLGMVWVLGAVGAIQDQRVAYRVIQGVK